MKTVFGVVILAAIYGIAFLTHWALGVALLVGHVGYEVVDYLEQRALFNQLMEARKVLLDLDNSEEPPAREGNC